MNILALDLATSTGWATSKGKRGVKKFAWGEVPNGQRWAEFNAWLFAMVCEHKPDGIAYEAALYQKGKAAHVAHSLVAICEREAYNSGIPIYGFAVSTIKKHATGNGRAQKPEMWEAAKKRGLLTAETDDVVDAVWLCDLAVWSGKFEFLGKIG